MSIDTYLAQLAGRLSVAPATRAAILQEVHDHLEDAAQHRMASGMARAEAEEQVVAVFGDPAEVALRFNAVHPLHWDRQRFGVGILWGIAATWTLWTLLTYPVLVQTATQGQTLSSIDTSSPWSLFFAATPLSFGLFSVLALYWYWFVPLFVLLYGLTPFVWARRAHHGWQPGLAFGLGVMLGFPWLLPAVIYRWQPWNPLASLLPVVGIWLLAPVAVFAGWLGYRSLRLRPVSPVAPRGGRADAPSGPIRLTRAIALASCLVLALLALNSWSFVRAAGLHAAAALPPLSQQISAAQGNLSFTLREPSYVPQDLALVSVTATPGTCLNPCVSLLYHGSHGAWLGILEIATTPTPLPYRTSASYQVSQGTVGDVRPTWWLGDDTTMEHQASVTWVKDGIDFILVTNGAVSVDDLERVAGSTG
jgi:hypothetical protein